MLRFRRVALWLGCALLTVGFVTAEELAGAAARRGSESPIMRTGRPEENRAAQPASADEPGANSTIAPDQRVAANDSSALDPIAETGKLRRICRVTAYCDRGITASGVPSGPGQCAAPADIPFGSKVYIPALDRTFVVTDRTHRRFRHSTVDLFMSARATCREFGRSYLECEFTVVEDPPAYGHLRVPPVH